MDLDVSGPVCLRFADILGGNALTVLLYLARDRQQRLQLRRNWSRLEIGFHLLDNFGAPNACAANLISSSVFVRIELIRSRHRHPNRREAVQNTNCVADRLKYLIEELVAIGRLVEPRAAQFDPSATYPGTHHLRRNLAGTLDLPGLAVDNACRLTAP